jgi:hypothetical protein
LFRLTAEMNLRFEIGQTDSRQIFLRGPSPAGSFPAKRQSPMKSQGHR